jgi:hypothetical protein
LLVGALVSKAQPDGPYLVGPIERPLDPQSHAESALRSDKGFRSDHRNDDAVQHPCCTPSMPVKSVKELIAFARARPGVLNYASAATGTTSHISAELFKSNGRRRYRAYSLQGGRARIQRRAQPVKCR